MIVLTLVWCSLWCLSDSVSREVSREDPLTMIAGQLSAQHNTAAWAQGTYVAKKSGFSVRFSNLSTIMSPTFYRYELLIRALDSGSDVPTVFYRNKKRLIELQIEQDLDDELLMRIPISKDVIHDIPNGLRLSVSRDNLNIEDETTPLLVAYGSDSGRVNMASFLEDSFSDESRMKRDVRTNMVDSDDAVKYPCHLEDLWLDLKLGDQGRETLHPREVNIRQCTGSCSLDLVRKGANRHSLMQAYLSRKIPKTTHEPSCCVPVEYDSQMIVFRESDSVSYEEIPDLIVTKCGCR